MKTGVKTAICFVGLAYMYVLIFRHIVYFLFMSNYITHNFSGWQFCFDLDMELQISWENAMSDCKIICVFEMYIGSLMGSRLISDSFF